MSDLTITNAGVTVTQNRPGMKSDNNKLNDMKMDVIEVTLTTDAETIADDAVIAQRIELANVAAKKGGSCLLQSITLINTDSSTESPSMELVFLEDNTAIAGDEGNAVSASDTTAFKVLGAVTVSNWSILKPSDNEFAIKANIGMVLKTTSDTRSVWVSVINRSGGNYTPSGTNVLKGKFGIVQD